MLYFAKGDKDISLSEEDLKQGLYEALDALGSRKKVLAIPPDITRFHSKAGELTELAWRYYGSALTDILPAIGTHFPMTVEEIKKMYRSVPPELFRIHNWRDGLATLGTVPAEYIRQISEGKVDFDWPAQVDKLVVEGGFDLILSIGQVVPHEVAGMANHSKNIFIGTGGAEGINKSHFLGAVCGMERIMGRADAPVRKVLDYASERFAKALPIIYALTVVEARDGQKHTRGLFIGDDRQCFELAVKLSQQVNLQMLDTPLEKVVVWLDRHEYKSAWLGNKSIYRTRMAIADGGELIILAPGLKEFGEDKQIDSLIRKYGYCGTEKVLALVEKNDDLRANLSAAAHLIHGSSEGRFKITYCPGGLSEAEIRSVNFQYADLKKMMQIYNPDKLGDGFNTVGGEKIFYISNPGMGLWAYKKCFNQ